MKTTEEFITWIKHEFQFLRGADTAYIEFPVSYNSAGRVTEVKAPIFQCICFRTPAADRAWMFKIVTEALRHIKEASQFTAEAVEDGRNRPILFERTEPTITEEEGEATFYWRIAFWDERLQNRLTQMALVKQEGGRTRSV